MATYVVFEHKVFGKKAIKTGFSAGGFFFTLIWSLIHKMWPLATTLFIWAMVAGAMDAILSGYGGNGPSGAMFAQFVFYHLPAGLIFGFQGNSILKSQLLKQGYEKITEIEAKSVGDAIAKTADKSTVVQTASYAMKEAPQSCDLVEQITKLNNLRQQGALSEEEYQSAKAKLLN